MQTDATTVAEYLAGLPVDRRAALEAVRQIMLDKLPAGYEEAMNWGMITYQVPLARYPPSTTGNRWLTLDLPRRRTTWRFI